LITGETGTGKELVANAIQATSKRKDQNFVKINCSVIPQNLLASELFGHVKGAFTDAKSERIGRFELADKGTIFLDEIAEMPLQMQTQNPQSNSRRNV
jgi:transcriptional regulator with GAF, ATPase, and Fis domain